MNNSGALFFVCIQFFLNVSNSDEVNNGWMHFVLRHSEERRFEDITGRPENITATRFCLQHLKKEDLKTRRYNPKPSNEPYRFMVAGREDRRRKARFCLQPLGHRNNGHQVIVAGQFPIIS
ncbi:hypothetical protein BLOT_014298 [Blomia tropicalis]|nr:hypothetical protein BLOT_014298 [Blomia tropicalis]